MRIDARAPAECPGARKTAPASLYDHCGRLTLEAASDRDARVLARLYRYLVVDRDWDRQNMTDLLYMVLPAPDGAAPHEYQDSVTRAVYEAVRAVFPEVHPDPHHTVYRHVDLGLRVLIVSPRFADMPVGKQDELVTTVLKSLPAWTMTSISNLWCTTPEKVHAVVEFHAGNPNLTLEVQPQCPSAPRPKKTSRR